MTDWFYEPAKPLYIGKHERLTPAPKSGGYVHRFELRHPTPQVELMTNCSDFTWIALAKKFYKKMKYIK